MTGAPMASLIAWDAPNKMAERLASPAADSTAASSSRISATDRFSPTASARSRLRRWYCAAAA